MGMKFSEKIATHYFCNKIFRKISGSLQMQPCIEQEYIYYEIWTLSVLLVSTSLFLPLFQAHSYAETEAHNQEVTERSLNESS